MLQTYIVLSLSSTLIASALSTGAFSVMSAARIPALRCSLCGRLFVSRAEAADILGTLAKELDYVKLICEDCRRQQAARIIALKK
jgi:hypothetical protein